MLGGLGVIIGTFGLGMVLLRKLAERKQEIALYQSLGFKREYIFKLFFAESLFVLLAGTGIGMISAFAGILPSFFASAVRLPVTFLSAILLIIWLSGIIWIYFPLKSFLKKDLISSLRKE